MKEEQNNPLKEKNSSNEFQKKRTNCLKAFGNDLNDNEITKAKVGDWIKKSSGGYYQIVNITPAGAVVKRAFDRNFIYAKHSINVDGFAVELTNLKNYQFLETEDLSKIKNFFNDDPEKESEFLRYTDTMLSLREKILTSNFKEAELEFRQFNFYHCTVDKVAFIVNLKDYGDCVAVTYGFTSIADPDHLKHYGEDNNDIKLRFSSVIRGEQDKSDVAREVQKVYDTYYNLSKDEILSLKKEKQKQFLQKISDKLKPLGFKKKGAKWTVLLNDCFCLEFEAQKSQWSDEYYFNVSVYHKNVQFPCYYTRLNTNGKGLYNWQLMTDKELNCLLNHAINNILIQVIKTPLAELGVNKDICQGCTCPRTKCDTCWVQKNLWEANETE